VLIHGWNRFSIDYMAAAAKRWPGYGLGLEFAWRADPFRWDGSRGEAEGVYLDDHSYR
jgi:hypothetical protein